MKKIKNGLFCAISFLLLISCVAFAASKKVEITGMLRVGISESGIDSEGGEYVTFPSNSAIAEKIISKCEAWKNCSVSAITDDYNRIVTLIDVKKISEAKDVKQGEKIFINGSISVGSLDSSIESDNGKSYSFLTESPIGKKIYDICKNKDLCQLNAIVDKDDFIVEILNPQLSGDKKEKNKPSFDCLKASSFIEKAICNSDELSVLDNQLMEKYKIILTDLNNQKLIKSEQRDWLKNIRNKCKDELCLKVVYRERIKSIENREKNNNENTSNSSKITSLPIKLIQGMPYDVGRMNLLNAGWQAEHKSARSGPDESYAEATSCNDDLEFSKKMCRKYEEFEGCGHYCDMYFVDVQNGKRLRVMTNHHNFFEKNDLEGYVEHWEFVNIQ
jgi:uncharacterized protein